MFSKVAILATLSLALSVVASPDGNDYECNTGRIYCCEQTQQVQTAAGAEIAAIVGLATQGLTGLIGAACSPITVVGTGSGASCTSQPVCCKDNYSNGAVVAQCNPINAVL